MKVNRDVASLGADLTSTGVNKDYITCSKYQINSTVQDTEVNNMLPLMAPTNNDNEEILAGAATTLSLFVPPTNNSNSQNLACVGFSFCLT